jgi:hypothetical protein
VHLVRYKVCSKIDGKDKMLAPKIDSLWKHARRRKALVANPAVCATSEYYMNKFFVHAKNERLYATIRKFSNKFVMLLLEKGKRNLCDFLCVFTCWLKEGPWLILKAWASYYISLMSRTFQNPLFKQKWLGDGILHARLGCQQNQNTCRSC